LFNLKHVFSKIPGDRGGRVGIRDARKNIALAPIYGAIKILNPQYMGSPSNNFRAKRGFLAKPNCPECINSARYGKNFKKYGIIPVDVAGEIQNEPFGALKPYNDFGSWVAPFKGEIQNEPFGALKHIQSIAFLLFAYG